MVEKSYAVEVPLDADDVASPVVRYGHPMTAIFFPVKLVALDVDPGWGRVTFEGFDSLRCCRGEHAPYPADDYGAWVYEVVESRWLRERHEYEWGHYQTPLLEEYHHYLFTFHDEFVEAIAKGIWVEPTGLSDSDEVAPDHPLMPLPVTLPADPFVLHRLTCEVRTNPLPLPELVERSKLCSQKLFQFFLTLEGTRSASYSAELRTVWGRSTTRMRCGWPYPDGVTIDGIATVEDMMPAWEKYVRGVAQRRMELGKSD